MTIACRHEPRDGQSSDTLDDLAGQRPGEGWLSLLPWAPFSPGKPPQVTRSLRRSEVRLGAALTKNRTAESLRRHALVSLATGDTERAVAELIEATDRSPGDASLWSDLAAARLQRGDSLSDPFEIVLALAAADHAVRLDLSLRPARFNRGLALERLSLRRAAQTDWRNLAASPLDHGWSREARAHVSSVALIEAEVDENIIVSDFTEMTRTGEVARVRSTVSRFPQRSREYVTDQALPLWATQDGKAAEQSLAVVRAVGQALAIVGGDRMTVDTVAQIDRLIKQDHESLEGLRRALRVYGQGVAHERREEFVLALSSFNAARRELLRLNSPFAGWASFQAAYCKNRMFDLVGARDLLLDLLSSQDSTSYQALHGRVLWVLALIDVTEGNLTASMAELDLSLKIFKSLGEKDNIARLRAFLAVNLDYLGRPDEAWRQLYPALRELDSLAKIQARMVVLQGATSLAYEQGEMGIAKAFIDELVRTTRRSGQASAMVEALRWRAVILYEVGSAKEAMSDIKEAWLYYRQITESGSRRSLEGDLRLAEGELMVGISPDRAIQALNPAIEIFRAIGDHYQLGRALFLRASAEDRLGRFDEEESDLGAAIEEMERQRDTISVTEERVSFLDRRRELLDSMISFQLRQHHPMAALSFSETAKARVLWDWLLTQPGIGRRDDLISPELPLRLKEDPVQDLPEGVAVVEYAVLPRRTIIWLLRSHMEPHVASVEIGADDLDRLVKELRHDIMNDQEENLESTAGKLYDVLFKPIARNILPRERLVFIPDGTLHSVPFGLLRDQIKGTWLIQDHICSIAPSIRIFKAGLKRDEALARNSPPRALVVVEPDFDRTLNPSLSRQTAGDLEESAFRNLPGSKILRDHHATRTSFLRLAGDFEIVHFGGHSIINHEFPLLSQMIFAADTKDPARGVLYSGDILHQRFPRTRLVVLASCSTALGRISRTEGIENLARPFLAAGVPTVVASLWDVKDRATAEFFTRFYRQLQPRHDVASTMQAVQLEGLREGKSPLTWGAFEVIGGASR